MTATDTRRVPGEPLQLALWGVGSLAVALVHNRLWASPNLAFFTVISRSLGRNPFGNGFDGDYLLTNLLGPSIARALGQTEPHEYVRLHLLLLLVGLAAVVVAAYRRFGLATARLLCVLVAASPALTVAMEWLGQPDALTLPLALGVVVATRRWTAFGLAVLLGLAHAEQGLVIALAAVVVRTVIAEGRIRDEVPALLGGVVTGRAVTEVYLRLNDIVVSTPRTSFLDLGVGGFVEHHLQSNGVIVYALWGPLWIAVVVTALRFLRSGASWPPHLRQQWAALATVAGVAVLPMLITLDETRVYSLVTAPLLLGWVVLTRRTLDVVPTARLSAPASSAARVALAAGVLAAAPAVFTAGDAYVSYDLPVRPFARFLVDGTHPGELTQWLLAPFGFEVPTAG